MKSVLRNVAMQVIKVTGTLCHGVLVLLLFWVTIDLVQSYVATGPQRPGLLGVALAPFQHQEPVQVAQVQSRTHEYGYFKSLAQKVEAPLVVAKAPQTPKSQTPKVYTKVPMVRVVAPKSPVYQVVQVPDICKPTHRGGTPWAPWCQTGAKSL